MGVKGNPGAPLPLDHPGPLFLPGLSHPVTAEEYNDPGDPEVDIGSPTCSNLLVEGITSEMDRVLRSNQPPRVAFLNWDEEDFLTGARTGFTFKIEHFRGGELTKAEEQ